MNPNLKNFAVGRVFTAPSPATSGTTVVLESGQGADMPDTPFQATVFPAPTNLEPYPTNDNAEIVTVTNVATDTLTITRAQEGTTARAIVVGDVIAATLTTGVIDAIRDEVTVVKAATESVSSSTAVQDDDELFFATAAGALYEIELWILYDSPAGGGTPDLKCDFGEDTTIRGQMNGVVISTADAAAVAAVAANQTATLSVGTNAAERLAMLKGHHRGNGGTWRLRWAQNTSNGNATRVLAGSWLRYRRVA